MAAFARQPFFVQLMALAAVAMLLPSIHALVLEDFRGARVFLYGFILTGLFALLVGLAVAGQPPAREPRRYLLTVFFAYILLPVLFAIPFIAARPWLVTPFEGWFEMLSAFTTTGATLYDSPYLLSPSMHLWRGLVGWLGGFLIWVTAFAIMAPMNLGGFEVRATGQVGETSDRDRSQIGASTTPGVRINRIAARLAPVYAGLTGLLWLLLMISGQTGAVALIHAMSTLSTSGISPTGGVHFAAGGRVAEIFILGFLVFALSRVTFLKEGRAETGGRLLGDPEIRLAIVLVATLTAVLFLRHFIGAIEEGSSLVKVEGLAAALQALWGTLFTVASFLTTTGFQSADWLTATDWSTLETPGLLLIAMALAGGGIATTAGGVKLLRLYALYKLSRREVERLIHPHSIGGAGAEARRIRRQGATIAWVFLMLFSVSFAAVMVLLSLTGIQFETALVLAASALTTCGPLAEVGGEVPISYAGIPALAQGILAAAMVLGRLEALVIIALFNVEFWRR